MIDFATKHKSSEADEYRVASATALPVEPAQFDIAVSTQVIEYLADVDAALWPQSIDRELSAGARI